MSHPTRTRTRTRRPSTAAAHQTATAKKLTPARSSRQYHHAGEQHFHRTFGDTGAGAGDTALYPAGFLHLDEAGLQAKVGLFSIVTAVCGTKAKTYEAVANLYRDIICWEGVAAREPVWTPEHTLEDVLAWIEKQVGIIRKEIQQEDKYDDVAIVLNMDRSLSVVFQKESHDDLTYLSGIVCMSFLKRLGPGLHDLVIDVIRVVAAHVGLPIWNNVESQFLWMIESELADERMEDDETVEYYENLVDSYRTGEVREYQEKLCYAKGRDFDGNPESFTIDYIGKLGAEYAPLKERVDAFWNTPNLQHVERHILEWLACGLNLLQHQEANVWKCNNYPLSEDNGRWEDEKPTMPMDRWMIFWGKLDDFICETLTQNFRDTAGNYGEIEATWRDSLRGHSKLPSPPIWQDELARFLAVGHNLVWEFDDMIKLDTGQGTCPNIYVPTLQEWYQKRKKNERKRLAS